MKQFTYVLIIFITLAVGILVTSIYKNSEELFWIISQTIQTHIYQAPNQPRFLRMRDFGKYVMYKSAGSKPVYGLSCDLCIEIGDISIEHNTDKTEQVSASLKDYCGESKYLAEKGLQLNETGQKIGEKCYLVYPESGASIFWTEGENNTWRISASTLKLAKEFESSEEFRLWKSAR